MKTLILSIAVLVGGVFLALFVQEDAGYVMLGYGRWSVEMSLVLFVVLVVLLTAALYYTFRFLGGFIRMPKVFRRWRKHRNARKAHEALARGLLELEEGNWKKAEKHLLSYVRDSYDPSAAYLAAAKVAQAQGSSERRDQYLQMARKFAKGKALAVDIAQAEMQLEQGQLKEALETLQRVYEQQPKNDHVFELLVKTYGRLDDWKKLLELLPEISRRHIFAPDRYLELERRVYERSLHESLKSSDSVDLHNAWNRMPKHLKQDVGLLVTYLRNVVARREYGMAEPMLREALKRNWNDQLVYLYGIAQAGNPAKQLAWAEGLLRDHPDDPVLLLTLGRLSMAAELWGKARGYLERAIELSHNPEAYYLLAQLLERTEDDQSHALEYYRRGLVAASSQGEQRQLQLLPA